MMSYFISSKKMLQNSLQKQVLDQLYLFYIIYYNNDPKINTEQSLVTTSC
jgi:hypothetical protein